mmetsp:Transcript_89179/g.260717  ORF Transcript_89179/g.260717 Transcript_89179/m.260717 type:complete len:241 (-) Transcript_89179:265-987(-)
MTELTPLRAMSTRLDAAAVSPKLRYVENQPIGKKGRPSTRRLRRLWSTADLPRSRSGTRTKRTRRSATSESESSSSTRTLPLKAGSRTWKGTLKAVLAAAETVASKRDSPSGPEARNLKGPDIDVALVRTSSSPESAAKYGVSLKDATKRVEYHRGMGLHNRVMLEPLMMTVEPTWSSTGPSPASGKGGTSQMTSEPPFRQLPTVVSSLSSCSLPLVRTQPSQARPNVHNTCAPSSRGVM